MNVVVSTFSALEAGAGASRSRAQKMFPTTRQFDTLMLSRCAVLRVVVAGVCVHPKLAHGTCLDGFDFLWLLVAFVDSLLLLHTLCRERHTHLVHFSTRAGRLVHM